MDHLIASKNKKQIFAGVRSLGNAEVARLLDCAEPTVSELSSEAKYKFNFNTCADLLARMGMKIVPAENRCVSPDRMEMLIKLANLGMEKMNADDLWEE